MDSGMWDAIAGSAVLVVCGFIGWFFLSHTSSMKADSRAAHAKAEEAHNKAHSLELAVLEQRAIHAEEMRKSHVALLEYQLLVANNYVRKIEYDGVISEVFRKLEGQDREQDRNFSEMRTWLNTKFETLASQINLKQDRKIA
jgi:hypothetical protein